nr:heme ABC exporter ATP-binding protein CcmA [uncultured Brevundimonas sp.]
MIHNLSLTDITVSRGERRLFHGLNLEIKAGEALALTGANGAGKTSLLRAIAGLLRPDAGNIAFSDGDGNLLDEREARGRETHFLGHQDGLKTARTAREELGFQCDWLGHTQYGLDHAVEAFALQPLLNLEVRRLSAGQRRRLAMGRLVGSPRALWLLDEPMAPLDTRWRAAFGGQMQRHLDNGGLIVAAVHDPLPLPTRTLDLGGLG